MKPDREYTGIKVSGMNHWLWFKSANIKEESGQFIGRAGWGDGGAFTEIECAANLIEGRVNSDTPQYND